MIYRLITFIVHRSTAPNLRFIVALIFVFVLPPAHASFTDSLTIGNAKALSLGHAVTADPPGIDSIHFNPAGLTRLKGRQVHIKGVFGLFETNYDLGEYGEYEQGLINQFAAANNWLDADGNLTQEGQDFFYDEALNSKSEVEGPTVMLPGGMVDLPFSGGVMGGASYSPPGSDYTFATNVYAPMMSGYHRASDDPGRFFQNRGAFTLLTYFSPSVGIEISEKLQVGMSVNFSYAGMGLDLPAREPHQLLFYYSHPWVTETFCNPDGTPTGTPDINLCHRVSPYQHYGDLRLEADQPLVLGFNAGLLWSPEPWLTFGLAYNSAIKTKLKGKYDFPIEPYFKEVLLDAMSGTLWPTLVASANALGLPLPTYEETANQGSGDVKVEYEIPQHLSAGVSIQVTPRWKYNFDVKWTEWSAFSKIKIEFDEDIAFLKLGALADKLMNDGNNGIEPNSVNYLIGLQDVVYWGMGTEFQYSERLALRAGFENRPSAVPDDAPNAFIPINDGILYSVGFAYEFANRNLVDFAIGYMKSESHYPPCSAKLGNACDPTDVAYAPYAGQDIRSKVSFLLFEVMYSRYF